MRWLALLGVVVCFGLSVVLQAGAPDPSESIESAGAAANVAGIAGVLNLGGWASLALFAVSFFWKRRAPRPGS